MTNPLVSVYITNFNYEKYLVQSINSVLAQTFQNFELLIIDDGSTDKSHDVIEQYRNYERMSIIYQQNKGLNITNNVAMRASRGKYIMRLDADDFLEPHALEVMSSMLEADNELGLIFPDYYYVDSNGVRTGEERRHDFEKEVSLYDQPAHGACTMIRLQFLKKLGGYNESFTCQDGYDLWLKFITHFKVINVNKPLFSYRRHAQNLTTNENRILATRRAIKQAFVREYIGTTSSLTIIPVRNTKIGERSWPLYLFGNETILEQKVRACLAATTTAAVVVTTSDKNILSFCHEHLTKFPNVLILERPENYSSPNQTLNDTVGLAISYASEKNIQFDSVMTVSLEYPFVTSEVLDDMVNTMILFKSDAVLSVRPDNKMYYQHTGHTLKPILDQNKFTKLEREALYKAGGGLMLSSLESFKKSRKMNHGRISHVVVDEKTAFGVFSGFELEIFESLTKKLVSLKEN